MKRHALLLAAAVLCSGAAMSTDGCYRKDPPVISAQLGEQNQKLVDDLKAQVAALKEKVVAKDKVLDKVAGSAVGIDVGVEHLDTESKGKTIVKSENGLIKQAVGEPSAEERAAAAERTMAILQDDLQKQKDLYGKAQSEIDATKKAISEKDAEIKRRGDALASQEEKARLEREESKTKLQGVVDDYETKITNIKNEQAAKERRLWVNTLRFGGFGIILLGVLALAVTSGRALAPGLILIGSGALVILIGVGIDILTAQKWFPYACGVVGLLFLVGLVWFCWNLYQTHKNGSKTIAVLNDMKTEAQTMAAGGSEEGKKMLQTIQDHADYRFGDASHLDSLFVGQGLDAKAPKK